MHGWVTVTQRLWDAWTPLGFHSPDAPVYAGLSRKQQGKMFLAASPSGPSCCSIQCKFLLY